LKQGKGKCKLTNFLGIGRGEIPMEGKIKNILIF
jgi:hypothetical protein